MNWLLLQKQNNSSAASIRIVSTVQKMGLLEKDNWSSVNAARIASTWMEIEIWKQQKALQMFFVLEYTHKYFVFQTDENLLP
jgi:hypothetical protein